MTKPKSFPKRKENVRSQYNYFEFKPYGNSGNYVLMDRYITPTTQNDINDTTYLVSNFPYGYTYTASSTGNTESERSLARKFRDDLSRGKINFASSQRNSYYPYDSFFEEENAADRLTPIALGNHKDYPVQLEQPIEVPIPGDDMFGLRNAKGDVLRRDIIKVEKNTPNDTIFRILPNYYKHYEKNIRTKPTLSSDVDNFGDSYSDRKNYNNYAKLFNALVQNPKLKTKLK